MLACQDDGWLPGIPTLIASRLPPLWSCEMVSRIPTCRRSGNPGSSDPENLCNSTSNILEFQGSRFYHTLFTVKGRGIRRCGFGKPTPARFSDNEAWARRSLSCSVTKGPLRVFLWIGCNAGSQRCGGVACSFACLLCVPSSSFFLSNATRPVRCFIDSSWCMVLAWACFTIPRFACAIWWVLQKKCLQDCEFHMSDTAGSVFAPSLKGSLEIQENDQRRGQKKQQKNMNASPSWWMHRDQSCCCCCCSPSLWQTSIFSPPSVCVSYVSRLTTLELFWSRISSGRPSNCTSTSAWWKILALEIPGGPKFPGRRFWLIFV